MNQQPTPAPLCERCGYSAPKGAPHDCARITWNEAVEACANECERLEVAGFDDGCAIADRLRRLKR